MLIECMEIWKADEFYTVLWKKLINDDMFDNIKIYAFVLLRLAINPLLPYAELSKPVQMNDEKFSLIIKEQMPAIQRVKHILELELSQKTEVASLLLEEILKVTDYEKQIVLLAVILEEMIIHKQKELEDNVEK